MGWFKKTPDFQAIAPDMGPLPQKRFGLTGESEKELPQQTQFIMLDMRLWVNGGAVKEARVSCQDYKIEGTLSL